LFDNYIGIPFKNRESSLDGCDCYGLVRLVYKDLLGIDVHKPNASAFESKDIEDEYLAETSLNWYETKEPKRFDVIAMAHDPKHPKIIQHFGIMLTDTKMIHTLKGVGSHIVNIKDYSYFIKGFYRHGENTYL